MGMEGIVAGYETAWFRKPTMLLRIGSDLGVELPLGLRCPPSIPRRPAGPGFAGARRTPPQVLGRPLACRRPKWGDAP